MNAKWCDTNLVPSTGKAKCDERKLYGTQGCIGILPLNNPKFIIHNNK